jgi:hypothetical protein
MFLLSPANCNGRRATQLLQSTRMPLTARLDTGAAVELGEVFAFISGLYFRGKLAYARAFAPPMHARIISPSRGLLPLDTPVTRAMIEEFAATPIDLDCRAYREPLVRDLAALAAHDELTVVLLGSIASPKYTDPLLQHLGERVYFPQTFVGRGDMSRGGIMLRAADAGEELEYARLAGAVRRGVRPPKLAPLAKKVPLVVG